MAELVAMCMLSGRFAIRAWPEKDRHPRILCGPEVCKKPLRKYVERRWKL